MKKIILVVLCVCFLTSTVSAQIKVNMFRCGNQVFRLGTHKLEIKNTCGEPASEEVIGFVSTKYKTREYKIVELVYGPTRGLYYILRFEANTLVEIKQLME